MRSAIAFVFVTKAHTKQLVTIPTSNLHELTNKFVDGLADKLHDWGLKTWPLQHTDFESTTVAKSSHHVAFPQVKPAAVQLAKGSHHLAFPQARPAAVEPRVVLDLARAQLGARSITVAARKWRPQETEEQRKQLDQEAREGMEEYMTKIEKLAEEGNIRAQRTAWKWKVRKQVWNYLEDNDLADFPRPVHHRIPNFKNSAATGKVLATLPEFEAAAVVKVNPDTPQKSVRVAVLRAEKTLIVPQPRLRTGFFSELLPGQVSEREYNKAATAGGMKQLAKPLTLDDRPKVDIVVVGSSAVNPVNGARIGKGEGFAELEYGMMRELGMIDENTPVITAVHDCQVIEENMPPEGKGMMEHDVPVDIIVTPTQVIRVPKATRFPKPKGIYWNLLSEEKISQIRVLRELKANIEKEQGVEIKLAEQEEALPPLAKRGRRPR